MNKYELYNYIKSNYDKLLLELNYIFKISKSEFDEIIAQLLSINYDEGFYNSLSINFLDRRNIMILKSYLMSIGLSENDIKTLIIDIPHILLFSDRIDDIYPLFNGNSFEGIVILNNNEYKSFVSSLINEKYKIRKYKGISFEDMDLGNLSYYNLYENAGLIRELLCSLDREDIKRFYEIDDSFTLKDRLDACTSRESSSRFLFRSRNPIIERKAIRTSLGINGYTCDLCNDSYEKVNSEFIIPLDKGGEDDIHNIVCLCEQCHDFVVKNNVNLSMDENVLYNLKRRVYNKYPQYKNILARRYGEIPLEKEDIIYI